MGSTCCSHRPPDYSSVHSSCRGISPSRCIKAITFLANTDSSLVSVNIHPPLNKKLLLQPCYRSQRPRNKLIRSWSAYQHRTCFLLFLAPVGGGEATVRGSTGLPGPMRPAPPTTAPFGRGGEISSACRMGKAFGPKSQLTQPQAPAMVVMRQEQKVAIPPQHWGFPSNPETWSQLVP